MTIQVSEEVHKALTLIKISDRNTRTLNDVIASLLKSKETKDASK